VKVLVNDSQGAYVNVMLVDALSDAQTFYPEPDYVCAEVVDESVAAIVYAPLSKLQFLMRFTQAQRIAIRETAKTDTVLDDAVRLFDLSDSVMLNDPLAVQMVGYLVQLNLISAQDATAILTP
jgi:hypothetical protein